MAQKITMRMKELHEHAEKAGRHVYVTGLTFRTAEALEKRDMGKIEKIRPGDKYGWYAA